METSVRRDYSKFNEKDFKTYLLRLRWSHIYDLVDPTLIDSAIKDNITSILDLHAPVRTFRTGSQKNKLIKNIS